jgi:hypothetical protein
MSKEELSDLIQFIRMDIKSRPFVGEDAEVFNMIDKLEAEMLLMYDR